MEQSGKQVGAAVDRELGAQTVAAERRRRHRIGAAVLLAASVVLAGCYVYVPPTPSGTVTFERTLIDPANVGADVKAVGDIDGDGDQDVVAGDDSGYPLKWYENPSWTARTIDSRSVYTTDMEVGDVDRDGDIDIIVPDYSAGTILWFKNPRIGGGSTWQANQVGVAGAHDVQVGDQEGDGDLDVLVRGHIGDTVLFVQNTPTSWSRRVLPSPGGEGIGYGDLDADGDLDVAQNGWWLEAPANPVTGTWVRHDFASDWPIMVAAEVVDVDNDGRKDIVLAASESTGGLSWYRSPTSPRTGTWTRYTVSSDLDYVHQFVVADIDLDGDKDIAFAEMTQSTRRRIGWFQNAGGATSWVLKVIATTGSHNIRGVDIDRDGDIDIVGANYDPAPIELWRNKLR